MDHTFFLAMSYGATAVAIAVELVALALGRRRAWKQIDEERELEAQD
jgi:heme exporter protein CcmD